MRSQWNINIFTFQLTLRSYSTIYYFTIILNVKPSTVTLFSVTFYSYAVVFVTILVILKFINFVFF